jgi:ribosomal protein L22
VAEPRKAKTGKPADASVEADKEKAAEPKPDRKPAKAKASASTKAAKAEPKQSAKKPSAKKPAAKKTTAKTESAKTETAKKDAPAKKQAPAKKTSPKAAERKAPAEAPVVRARARFVRGSARKARLVADHIRGKDVVEARTLLQFSTRRAARHLERLLNSAVANAEQNHELVGDELRIREIHVDEGPTIKRYRPRAQGRATRINKRTAHMSISLTPKE